MIAPDPNKISRRAMVTATGVVGVSGLSGCMDLIRPEPPVEDVELSIVDIRSPSIGITSATIVVVLRLSNHADRPVPNPLLNFDLLINNQQSGSSSTTFESLAAKGEVTQRVGITIEYTDMSAAVAESMKEGDFEVQIQGTIESEGARDSFSVSK